MKILVECHHMLGDIIMVLPALTNLRKLYPNAQIDFIGGLNSERDILDYCELINDFYVINVRSDKLFNIFTLALKLSKNKYDLGIAFGASPKGYDVCFLKVAGCKRVVSYKNPFSLCKKYEQVDVDSVKHQTDKALAIVKYLGGENKTEGAIIDMSPTKGASILAKFSFFDPNKKTVGIVLGTGDFMCRKNGQIFTYNTKSWDADRFASVAEYFIGSGYNVILFGGKKEEELISQCTFPNTSANLVGKTSVLQMMSVMKNCNIIIGCDTGPMHCAAIMNVPTLTLFGPTSEGIIGPYAKTARYLRGTFECKNCYNERADRGSECKNHECMRSITVESVIDSAKNIIQNKL